MKPRILVLADDANLRAMLARCLLAAGYAVELAESAKRARDVLAAERIALAIVAADLQGAAADLARELVDSSTRVIAVIESEAVDKSSIPASGYLFKPLSEQDVVARVESLLQASPKLDVPTDPEILTFEGYRLDVSGRAFFDPSGAEMSLTRTEFSLLVLLAQRAGRALSRDELRQAILGRDNDDPDDRSVDMLVSRLRRKIEPDPKAPQMIVTVPGVGYKFGVIPQAASRTDRVGRTVAPPPAAPAPGVARSQPAAAREASAVEARLETLPAPAAPAATSPPHKLRTLRVPHWIMIGGAVMLVGLASSLLVFWRPLSATGGGEMARAPAPKFDASVIPLVNDSVRVELAHYAELPDSKALAISGGSGKAVGMAFGSSDVESAKREALERCDERSKPRICKIYAVGMDVVWSPMSLPLPLPADIHSEPLDVPLSPDDVPLMSDPLRHQMQEYENWPSPKSLAIKRQTALWNRADSRAETVRLTLERCSDLYQAPCLLLSVDGFLTMHIPKSHVIEDIFMVTTEPGMSAQERDRVGQVYRGKEWRALARGKAGWYPVAELPSEASVIEAALAECNKRDTECRLYAIGNFRVGAEK